MTLLISKLNCISFYKRNDFSFIFQIMYQRKGKDNSLYNKINEAIDFVQLKTLL